MTQKEKIRRHLTEYGSISSYEAFADYGITRLASVIFKLKKDGDKISSERITGKNRFGEPVNFSVYRVSQN